MYNFNPLDLLASITPFVTHCSRASLTEDLLDGMLRFDLIVIFKTLLTRHKGWLVLNPFYLWFFVTSIVQILAGEVCSLGFRKKFVLTCCLLGVQGCKVNTYSLYRSI